MNAVYQTSLSFTSQNLGGKKYSRIDKIKNICLGVVTVVGLILGLGAVFGGKGLLSIYSSDPEVLAFGMSQTAYYLRYLFSVRSYGLYGRKFKRSGIFSTSNDRILNRSLRLPCILDLYDLCFLPDP